MDRVKDFLNPRPSWAFVRIDQGKVELALRITVIVLAFLVFIPAAVLHTNVTVDTGPINNDSSLPSDIISALDSTDTGTEWIMVVCWTAIFVQALAITLRFINLEPVEKYIGIVLIAGIVLAALYIVSWFCGAIYFSAKSAEWRRLHKEHDTIERIDDVISFSNIANSIAATACFCFFALFGHIALLIWVVLWLVLRWQQLVTQQLRYQAGPESHTDALAADDEDED